MTEDPTKLKYVCMDCGALAVNMEMEHNKYCPFKGMGSVHSVEEALTILIQDRKAHLDLFERIGDVFEALYKLAP